MPSTLRTLAPRAGAFVALAFVVLAFVGTAAARAGAGSELGLGARVGIRFAVFLVVHLLVAGLLVAVGPRYTAGKVREVRDDPGSAFVWGLVVNVLVPIALVLLALTIVGLVVAIPGFLLLIPVGIVGNAVAVVALGAVLGGGRGDPGGRAVLLGALALAVVGAVPVLGDLLTRVVGLFGVGVVGRGLYQSWRG